jgi:pyridoxal phosphate enzyme (YggS family)
MTGTDPARRDEIAAGLADVRERIAAAARAAGRAPDEVTLVVVTKTRPATDVAILAGLGVTDVGENRDQEAAPKHAACADLGLRWHFIGQLQRNKARSVATYADVVESVDRAALVPALATAATRAERRLDVLVQVSLEAGWWSGGEVPPDRGGVAPTDLPALADAVAGAESLRLAGVMAVAPLGDDPAAAFARLAELAARLRADHPGAAVVSAGMSGDLEQAVAAGATHVRVGSAVLGRRSPLE